MASSLAQILLFATTLLADAKPASLQSCIDKLKEPGKEEMQEAFEWKPHEASLEKRISRRRVDSNNNNNNEFCNFRNMLLPGFANEVDRSRRGRSPLPDTLQSLFRRVAWRADFYDLSATNEEERCLSGYESLNQTDRCRGWERTYPKEGGVVTFNNYYLGTTQQCTLHKLVAGVANVWACGDQSTETRRAWATEAAEAFTNSNGLKDQMPTAKSDSWMEHACKVFGPMPFMWTCSKRLNIVYQTCGTVNAFVYPIDVYRNLPDPADEFSPANSDNTVYVCWELVDYFSHNPVFIGLVIAHEFGHLLQAGFGDSFTALIEGGATWLEGAALKNPPRPLYWFGGVADWNMILNAHFYASSYGKYYQMTGFFLTYLEQDGVLGRKLTKSLHRYLSYTAEGFGRGIYDYFLSYRGKSLPEEFTPIKLDVSSTNFPLAQAWLDYHVALAAECIVDVRLRPQDPKYRLPEIFQDHPFWDCSSYPVFWSADSKTVSGVSAELAYGGAQVWRLATPEDLHLMLEATADRSIRTVVLVAGDGHKQKAEVRELVPGRTERFWGPREVFVIQVNCDPKGEMIGPEDITPLWNVETNSICPQGCWQLWGKSPQYPNSQVQGLHTPELYLHSGAGAELTFDLRFDLEPLDISGEVLPGCPAKGWDGLQVRVHHKDGSITVLEPEEGYGTGPGGEAALWAWYYEHVYGPVTPCQNYRGWTGRSTEWPSFNGYRVDLSSLAGQQVRIEFLFASDVAYGGEGAWLKNLLVRAGGVDIYRDMIMTSRMAVKPYVKPQLPGGTVKPFTGVPVVAQYPDNHAPDTGFLKRYSTRKSPWSASWCGLHRCYNGFANLRHSYIGYPFRNLADTILRLHAVQEVCIQIAAPYYGKLQTVTVQTLRPKVAIKRVTLSTRCHKYPHDLHGRFYSDSSGALDATSHRYITQKLLAYGKDEKFLLCVGLEASDGKEGSDEPYLDLPLTPLIGDAKGQTFLWEPATRKKIDHDPFVGYTAAVWGEFTQCPNIFCILPTIVPNPPAFGWGTGLLARGKEGEQEGEAGTKREEGEEERLMDFKKWELPGRSVPAVGAPARAFGSLAVLAVAASLAFVGGSAAMLLRRRRRWQHSHELLAEDESLAETGVIVE